MTGVVGTGATTALEELGLTDAFDYIFTFSAGLPNASYFLAHQALLSSTVYIDDLSNSKFINFWKIWNIANIKYLIHILKDVKTLNVQKIFESKTKLFVQIKNITKNEVEFLELNESFKQNYFKLIEAAVDMPILCPGAIVINGTKYKDYTNGTEEEFIENILKYEAITDLLIIYNYPSQKEYISTDKNILEIIPKDEIHKIETRSRILKKGCEDMENLVKNIFAS